MNSSPKTSTEPTDSANWDAPDAGVWSLETAHYTGIAGVPMRDVLEDTFAEGFRKGLEPLGVPLSHVEMCHINGWAYMSFFIHDAPRKAGKPPPDIVLKVLSRVHPGFRRRTKIAAAAIAEKRAQALADDWFGEREAWIERILQVQRTDRDSMSEGELADHLRVVEALAADGFRRHFELIAGCIPLGHWLLRADQWGVEKAEARQAVMHSTPVHSQARQRLRRIANALDGQQPASLSDIRSHSSESAAALDDYLDHHGWWCTSDSLSADRVMDHPVLVARTVASIMSDDASDNAAAAADELVAKFRQMIPSAERGEFDQVVLDAHRSYQMLDDNSGILGAWACGVAGRVLREVAARLAKVGAITDAEDIWALETSDIDGLLRGTSPLTADQVAAMAASWRAQAQLQPPLHLNGEPSPPPDPGLFPAPVAQLVAAIGTFLNDKFNDEQTTSGIGDHTVTGRAVVTTNASDAMDRLEPGDILVTTATTPAYNSVLPMAGGIVVSTGGPSCHAAIVARELDLPAIVGLKDATITISDGAIIELDPVRAKVTMI